MNSDKKLSLHGMLQAISRVKIRRPITEEEWFITIGGSIIFLIFMMALLAPFISPYDPTIKTGASYQPPSWEHLMGTDKFGRDMFSRIIWGGRIPLVIGLVATIFSFAIGVPLGLLSGYFGGNFDRILSLVMDSIYSFPGLVLAIALAALLGSSVVNITVAIAVIYVPTFFRVVRGQVLSIKEELYVTAAISIGAKRRTIIARYIFPNTIPSIAIVFSLSIADAILTEAGLSFLGLGPVVPPVPDWAYDLQKWYGLAVSQGYWWLAFWPGFFIMLTVLGYSLFGEGLNEKLNPTLREV